MYKVVYIVYIARYWVKIANFNLNRRYLVPLLGVTSFKFDQVNWNKSFYSATFIAELQLKNEQVAQLSLTNPPTNLELPHDKQQNLKTAT